MINLTIKGLPNAVYGLNGKPYLLNTDYRVWIRFNEDYRSDDVDRDISYIFQGEKPEEIDDYILMQLIAFLNNPSSTPISDGSESDEKALDYIQDGEYIYSAIMATYGIDIIDTDMHWHKFHALCNNIIGDSTLWGYAKRIRTYRKPTKSDTYEKQSMKDKIAWTLPIELTEAEKQKVDEFNDYFL